MKNDTTSSPPGNKPSNRWGRGSAPRRQGSWSSPNVLQSLFHHKVFSFLIFFECLVTLGSKLTCALFKLWRILAPESQSSPAFDNVVLVGEIMGIQANHIEWVTKNHHCLKKVTKSEHFLKLCQSKKWALSQTTICGNNMKQIHYCGMSVCYVLSIQVKRRRRKARQFTLRGASKRLALD